MKQKTEESGSSANKEIEPTKTTIGIDIHDVEHLNVMNYTNSFTKKQKKTELEFEMKMSVWDFAGQLEYSVNHQVNKCDLICHF